MTIRWSLHSSKYAEPGSPSCPDLTSSKVLDVVVSLFLLPEGKVLLEKLDDALGVAEGLLVNVVDLVHGVLESSLSECASLLVILHDFVVEDREVQGEAELDGVAGGQGDLQGLLVGLEGLSLDMLELLSLGGLGDVAVVVSHHLDEERPRLILSASLAQHLAPDDLNDPLTIPIQRTLYLMLIRPESTTELLVLGVLLNRRYGAPCGALGGDEGLEGH